MFLEYNFPGDQYLPAFLAKLFTMPDGTSLRETSTTGRMKEYDLLNFVHMGIRKLRGWRHTNRILNNNAILVNFSWCELQNLVAEDIRFGHYRHFMFFYVPFKGREFKEIPRLRLIIPTFPAEPGWLDYALHSFRQSSTRGPNFTRKFMQNSTTLTHALATN